MTTFNRENPDPHCPGSPSCWLREPHSRIPPSRRRSIRAPVHVRYDDLNLANPEGARVLYRRISAAARKTCGPNFAQWYPGVRSGWKDCYKATVDDAVKQVNAPALTALHGNAINVAAR